jgi:O-antigen ligase
MISGFFFLPTEALRALFYISLLPSVSLLMRDKVHVIAFLKPVTCFALICVVFLGYMSLSVLWSDTQDLWRVFDKAKLGPFIALGTLSAGYVTSRFPHMIRTISCLFIMASILSGLVLIGLYLPSMLDHQDPIPRLHGLGRADNPVQAALLYGLAIMAILFGRPSKPTPLLTRAALCIVPLIVLILTQSRGPVLSMIISLSAVWVLSTQNKIRVALSAIFLSFILLGGMAYFLQHTDFMERGSTGRTEIWALAIENIQNHFWFGDGLATKRYYTVIKENGAPETVGHAHSLYLSTLAQGGIIGFILFMSMGTVFLISIRPFVRNPNYRPHLWLLGWVFMGGALGLVDFGGYMINISTEWLVFWWPMAFIYGYWAGQEKLTRG